MKERNVYPIPAALILSIACALSACSSDPESVEAPQNGVSTPTPSNDPPDSISPGDDPVVPPVTPPSVAPTTDLDEGIYGPLGGSGLDKEYAQFNDSPFAYLDFSGGYFYFEDFEDMVLESPGASASGGNFTTLEFGPTHHDSVDADDGLIDGLSLDGESWFYAVGRTGITWTFDADKLDGHLPTHVGLVWTDGRDNVTFEAYDAQGKLLGSVGGSHANNSFNGETIEDRFYGAVFKDGISAIRIRNEDRFNGIEIDHLQWGYQPQQ